MNIRFLPLAIRSLKSQKKGANSEKQMAKQL